MFKQFVHSGIILSSSVIFGVTAISPVFADDSQGNHQLNDSLQSISKDSGWVNNQANMYYYLNGKMVYGEQKIDNSWYYFDQITGAMAVGFKNLGDKTVYYNNQGKMVYGEQKIDNSWYYFDQITGAMAVGFKNLGNKTVYYNNQGKMVYGEQKIDNSWYYFDQITGAKAVGFKNLGNKTVYYNNQGKMVYGEQKINNSWYYFDQITGAMAVGFKNLGNKTVYYNNQGKMLYGEQKINNSWYYFDQITGGMAVDNSDEQKLVNLLNQKRKSLGLQPVILDTTLSARAKARAANAVANGGLPDNHMNTNGEVVGIGWSINQMIDAWYKETNMITNGTPGHRMWVANPRAKKVGFGIVGNTIVGISDIGQY